MGRERFLAEDEDRSQMEGTALGPARRERRLRHPLVVDQVLAEGVDLHAAEEGSGLPRPRFVDVG